MVDGGAEEPDSRVEGVKAEEGEDTRVEGGAAGVGLEEGVGGEAAAEAGDGEAGASFPESFLLWPLCCLPDEMGGAVDLEGETRDDKDEAVGLVRARGPGSLAPDEESCREIAKEEAGGDADTPLESTLFNIGVEGD